MMNGYMNGWYSGTGTGSWLFAGACLAVVILVVSVAVKYLGTAK